MNSRKQILRWLMALALLPWNLAEGTEFYPARIFSATQAVAAVTSGDFDPFHPDNELACLMANGDVMELALGASGWTATRIFRNPGSTPGFWVNPANRAAWPIYLLVRIPLQLFLIGWIYWCAVSPHGNVA